MWGDNNKVFMFLYHLYHKYAEVSASAERRAVMKDLYEKYSKKLEEAQKEVTGRETGFFNGVANGKVEAYKEILEDLKKHINQ